MVARHYAAADGAVKTPRQRGSMAALFSPELIRAPRPAGPQPRDGLQRALPGDTAMRFGLLYEAQRPFKGTDIDWIKLYKETLEQCVLADRLGFDNLWFVEHHFLTGFSGSPCPEVLLGALSQMTRRIRIGFGVCILPSHHPVRAAERAAMLDQLTDGRLEFGTGRSNAYEQIGQGIDPRNTRAMWEESITMIPQIWQSEEFSWEGTFWKVPKRHVLPKPYQKPHPPMYLACTQTESYDVAADKGIGVLSSATFATNILAEHVKRYRARVKQSTPVGAVVNDYWGNNVHAFCGTNNREARDLAALSLKTFFGPDKPYIRDRGLRPDGSGHLVRARHHHRRRSGQLHQGCEALRRGRGRSGDPHHADRDHPARAGDAIDRDVRQARDPRLRRRRASRARHRGGVASSL